MVRKIILLLILFLSTTACWYIGKTSEYGLPRRKIRPLPENTDYSKIDTMALYKSEVVYLYTTSLCGTKPKNIRIIEKEGEPYLPTTTYLKFYSKNKVGVFILSKQESLNLQRSFFNPQKAEMGYYYVKENDNKIEIKFSTIGAYSTMQVNHRKGTIYNDSINIFGGNNIGEIYVKRNVPKELLEGWEPDW